MLRKGSWIVSVLTLVVTIWSVSANAVIVTGGFSGTIFSGSDLSGGAGYFGVGSDLDNQPITGTFRYDTAQVPAGIPSGPEVIYRDPAFATDFLDFTVTINSRTYEFGVFPTAPGIQSISVIDNTDQLQYEFQRFGVNFAESISLRFISDLDFLSSTDVPTNFDFVASGIGLFPSGSFAFDLPNGDSAAASFDIATGFARVLPEPGTLSTLALALLGLMAVRRRSL